MLVSQHPGTLGYEPMATMCGGQYIAVAQRNDLDWHAFVGPDDRFDSDI